MLIDTVFIIVLTAFSFKTCIRDYMGASKKLMISIRVFLFISFSSRLQLLSPLKSNITAHAFTFLMNTSSIYVGNLTSLRFRLSSLRSRKSLIPFYSYS